MRHGASRGAWPAALRIALAVASGGAGCFPASFTFIEDPDGPTGSRDAAPTGTDADASTDTGSSKGPCSAAAPFTKVTTLSIDGIPSLGMTSPSLTSDELTIYFSKNVGSGKKYIWTARRTAIQQPFTGSSEVPGINFRPTMTSPHITRDGTLYASSIRDNGDNEIDVFRGAAPQGAPNLNFSNLSTKDPFLWRDQMFFSAAPSGLPPYEIHARAGNDFDADQSLTGTSSGRGPNDTNPVVSADGLTLYWMTSGRSNQTGAADIWMATRPSTSSFAFTSPIEVQGVNTKGSEGPGWLSADNCRLYYFGDQGISGGDYSLLVAER